MYEVITEINWSNKTTDVYRYNLTRATQERVL